MKKRLLHIVLLPLLGLFLFHCADNIDKSSLNDGEVRIEYSLCTGCLECVEQFTCPQGAIYLDERTGKMAVDANKCVRCMKCIDAFTCPEGAFLASEDTIGPADIEDLTATSDTTGALTIRFTAPGDDGREGMAWRYEASITDPDGTSLIPDYEAPLPALAGMTEVWNLCGLPQNVTATVRVQAFDEVNRHSNVAQQSVMITGVVIDSLAPATIDDLTATAGEASIELRWTAPGDDGDEGSATAYDLRYATSFIDEANWAAATQVNDMPAPAAAGEQQSITLSDIPQLTQLYFCLRASDEADNLSLPGNNAQTATTGDITPPSAIETLTVGSTTASTMNIRWTAPGDNGDEGIATAYVMKLSTEPITAANWAGIEPWPQSLAPQPAGSQESYTFTGLEQFTLYYAAVEALDDASNTSGMSNVAQATTEGVEDTTPPAAITNLTVEEQRADLMLSWTAPGDDGDEGTATSYSIRVATAPITESNWDDAQTLPSPPTPQQAGTTEYYFAAVDDGETYYFGIKATDDAANTSALSNVAQITLEADTTPPGAITDLGVTETYATSGNMTIHWTAPGDDGNTGTADHYLVRYSPSPITEDNWDGAAQVLSVPTPGSAGTSQTCGVSLLQNGMIYYFAVRAVDEAGNVGDMSNSAGGKIVYTIISNCHDCNNCINRCPNDAIYDAGPRKAINPALCDACATCVPYCPYNSIRMWAVAYE